MNMQDILNDAIAAAAAAPIPVEEPTRHEEAVAAFEGIAEVVAPTGELSPGKFKRVVDAFEAAEEFEETEDDIDWGNTPSSYDSSPAPAPVLADIKGLDEKAVLVQLKRRMYSPYKLDREETDNYGAGNVNKRLFEGNNMVKDTIATYTAVYQYVKENTVPWTKGVDMLNIEHYFEFSSKLGGLITEANDAVNTLHVHWDMEVQRDLQRLRDIAYAKNKPHLADPDDYPSAGDMFDKFSIDVRYLPVPTVGDFRVGISDEDKASLQQQLTDAQSNASNHILNEMIEPMKKAVEKLDINIGEKGSVFRDTLIDNLVSVADRMNKVNLSNDSRVQDRINELRSLVGAYSRNKDMLRNSPVVRKKAASQISALVNKMGAV